MEGSKDACEGLHLPHQCPRAKGSTCENTQMTGQDREASEKGKKLCHLILLMGCFLQLFKQGALHFYFALCPINYLVGFVPVLQEQHHLNSRVLMDSSE